MTDASEEFDRFATSVKATANEIGTLVVSALLEAPDRPSTPTVGLDLDAMLAVIQHVRPRVIYLIESCFDLDDEASSTNEDDEEGEGDGAPEATRLHPKLEKLVRKWLKYDGKPCVAFASL